MAAKTAFENIIIIGYGHITAEVIKHVYSLKEKYSYNVEYIEHEVHEFNTAKTFCNDNGIECSTVEDKQALADKFMAINNRTLIVSASNNYLFPKEVLDKSNITVINFHNALLPKFPGRNAPSWVIYEGEKETGITWHYVTNRVDAGNIIIQKKTDISPDIKAYELASVLMGLAFEAFSESFEGVLLEEIDATVQNVADNRKMYLSKDVPGNAHFDINDDWEDIYRLLRATDYAKYDIFPSVTTEIDGKKVTIVRYKIVDNEKLKSGEGFVSIKIDDEKSLQLKYKIE